MANEKKKMVTEDELLKALGDLEEHADEYGDDDEEIEAVSKAAKDSDESGSEESDESDESDEESVGKAHTEASPGMPDDTKQANGGFASQKGASEDREHFETNADEEDPTGASMKSLVEDDDTLRKGFEVSAFLEALTDATTESVDRLAKSQMDFQNEQRAFNAKMQKAMVAMGNMLLKTQKSMVDAGEQPVVARPRSVLSKSEVAERFNDAGTEANAPRYTKSQTLDALTELAVKGDVPALVVSAYEASGHVDPTYVGHVNAKLKALFG